MKSKTIFVSILFVVLLGFASFMLFETFYVIDEVKVYSADVYTSTSKSAINIDRDAIHFGIVRIGWAGERTMTIFNPHTTPRKVSVTAKGEIAPWFNSYVKNDSTIAGPEYILEPGENKVLSMVIIPDGSAVDDGKYYGQIKVIIRKDIW